MGKSKNWYSNYGKLELIKLDCQADINNVLYDGVCRILSNNVIRYTSFPIRYTLTLQFESIEAIYSAYNLPLDIYYEFKRRPRFHINNASKINWDKFAGHDISINNFLFKMESFSEIIK